VTAGVLVTITGTASDSGGKVGGVEVSTDNGATWHRATGRTSWSYDTTFAATGSVTVKSRAADDSGNLENPGAGHTITVTPATGSEDRTIFALNTTPSNSSTNEGGAVEVGVKFRSDIAGVVSGVRFYKGAGNTGTHIGNLWAGTGANLGSVTFTAETASGWQRANFATPITISPNTTYIVSYHAPNGHYSGDNDYFASSGVDNGNLHALANGVAGGNGVYNYGSTSAFPTDSYRASNYWVDVIFNAGGPSDTVPPTTPTNPSGTANATGRVDLTACLRCRRQLEPEL
jgi:hypothetical protein